MVTADLKDPLIRFFVDAGDDRNLFSGWRRTDNDFTVRVCQGSPLGNSDWIAFCRQNFHSVDLVAEEIFCIVAAEIPRRPGR